ncbi:hypothetical protein [Leptolyngbya sp. FACHB-16]|nr:hypothetical protein [Leptolyngbya sp. FACHB-16]
MTERLDRIEVILEQLAKQQQGTQAKLDAVAENLESVTQQLEL